MAGAWSLRHMLSWSKTTSLLHPGVPPPQPSRHLQAPELTVSPSLSFPRKPLFLTPIMVLPVRSVYAYEAQGADELSLQEGQMVELSAGPSGGQNYADGWWEGVCIVYLLVQGFLTAELCCVRREGFDARGKKGIFPSNYVRTCSKLGDFENNIDFHVFRWSWPRWPHFLHTPLPIIVCYSYMHVRT